MRHLIAAILLCAATLVAQNRDAVIAGSVRDALSGAPIPDVELQAFPRGGANVAVSETLQRGKGKTDQAGNFRFEKLAAGEYQLSMSKLGYVGSNYSGGATKIVVASPSPHKLLLTLVPTAAIEGRILDAHDKPVANAYIYAGPPESAISAESDQHGRYRIEYLAPGDYRITIGLPYRTRGKTVERDPKTGDIYGYPGVQYYPGTDDPAAAGVVSLAAGINLAGFDMRLRRIRLSDLRGQIIDAVTREPLMTGDVELTPDIGFSDETHARRAVGREDAGFRFELLRPGRYALLIYRDRSKDSSPYVHQIDLGAAGIANLRVSVPSFGSVSGKLIMPEKAKSRGPFRVTLARAKMPFREAQVGTDGSFEFDNMPPGRWSVQIEWPKSFLQQDLYIASIRQNGLTDSVMIGEGSSSPIEIDLSDQLGQLSGTVAGEDNHPVSGARILVSPALFPFQITANRDGYFVTKLPPGDYTLSAWPETTAFSHLPAEKTRACGDRILKVKVAAGASSFIRLSPCKIQ